VSYGNYYRGQHVVVVVGVMKRRKRRRISNLKRRKKMKTSNMNKKRKMNSFLHLLQQQHSKVITIPSLVSRI
jgi:hypothetical protein